MITYVRKTYINSTTFKPSMWAGLDADGKATNNGAEAFHRHFGDLFGYLRCKPSLFHFLRNVKRYNTLKDIKLRSSRPNMIKASDVENQMALFKNKRINARTLLYRLSKKNQPKTRPIYTRKI